MIRKLKTFGFGSVVVLVTAIVVVSAPASEADNKNPGHFTAEEGTTEIVAEQTGGADKNVLDAHGVKVIECSEVVYQGIEVDPSTATSVTVLPKFGGCSVPVHINGCHILVTIGTKRNSDNTAHIKCPENKQIELTSTLFGGCNMTFGSQTMPGGLAYAIQNPAGKPHNIEVTVTVKNLHYERDGLGCSILGKTAMNAEYTGKVTVKGFDENGNQTGITATGSTD